MEEINLESLEIYRLGRELSRAAWQIYQPMDWHTRKIIGDQFITAIDSYSANVAEGHGRFHYLDRAKFLFNARGSLFEGLHWLNTIAERGMIKAGNDHECRILIQTIAPKLNGFISSQFERNSSKTKSTTAPNI